jgi:hypothetical protein
MRAAEERGEILQANHQPRPEGAEAHHVMDIARQNRQRQADGEIAGKVKNHNGNDAQIEAQSAQCRFSGRFGHGVLPGFFTTVFHYYHGAIRKSAPTFRFTVPDEAKPGHYTYRVIILRNTHDR